MRRPGLFGSGISTSLPIFRKARQMIGLVPQELHIDMFETVQDTVRFSRGLFGLPPNEAHIEKSAQGSVVCGTSARAN